MKTSRMPIFIHSLFRTGSTYIWSKFRQNEDFWCYYEPFHQNLAHISTEKPVAWAYDRKSTDSMRHPPMEKSHSFEYQGLLEPGREGLPFYKKSFCYDEFCNTGDNPDLRKYIDSLVAGAGEKRAVLQFNRSALRTSWFKKNYPDSFNIYILRNYKDQWFSYESMLSGNNLDVFFMMDLLIASVNMENEIFRPLAERITLFKYNSEKVTDEEMVYKRLLRCYSNEELFSIFYFIWFCSLVENILHADFILDIDLLSSGIEYRQKVDEVFKKLGIQNIAFDDANVKKYSGELFELTLLSDIKNEIETAILSRLPSADLQLLYTKISPGEKSLAEAIPKDLRRQNTKGSAFAEISENVVSKYGRFVRMLADTYVPEKYAFQEVKQQLNREIKRLELKELQIERLMKKEQRETNLKKQKELQEIELIKQKEKTALELLRQKEQEAKLLKEKELETARLKEKEQELQKKDESILKLENERQKLLLKINELKTELKQNDLQLLGRKNAVAQLKNEIKQKNLLLAKKNVSLHQETMENLELHKILDESNQLLKNKTHQLQKKNRELNEKNNIIRNILNSFSYRLGRFQTAPFRLVKGIIEKTPDVQKKESGKLAFIDHSFHKKSTATLFLINILEKYYDVNIIWDEAWNNGPRTNLGKICGQDYDVIILFQQINYSPKDIRMAAGKNLILIPMFDASGGLPDEFWEKFRHVKIINFSKSLHERLLKKGMKSKYVQYFPPAGKRLISPVTHGELSGFFWQRTNQITWKHIRQLIKTAGFSRIHIHGAVDPPGYPLVLPSKKEKLKYNVSVSEWFPSKDKYLDSLKDFNVYFSPRLYEGIGMSFLEAMAMGKCVVAPNHPTMNEYIVHGETGLLYDPRHPEPLDFSNIENICTNAREYVKKGRRQWTKTEKELLDFIKASDDGRVFPGNLYRKRRASAEEWLKRNFPRQIEVLNKIRNGSR